MNVRPMWECPHCGRRFVNRNQWHSCGSYSVDEFLAGAAPEVISLYRRFEEIVLGLEGVRVAPAKTRIGFQVRMIFAAVNALRDRYMDLHLCLTRRIDDARFRKIESLGPTMHVHHLRIRSADELDAKFIAWLQEAHSVGRQAARPGNT